MKRKVNNFNAISKPVDFIFNILLMIFCLCCVYPLLIVLGTSFTDEQSIISKGYRIIPSKISFAAYKLILGSSKTLYNAYGVTIFVTVVGTILSVLLIASFAYPLSRKELKYRKFFTYILFISMIFNGGLIPWYLVCTKLLHLRNTIYALIIPYLMNSFYVIILRTFFQTTIPDAVVESARIDGASELRTFFSIILPLSTPGLATIGIFTAIGYWNDWYLPLMLINKPELYNLQFMLQTIMTNLQFLTQNANVSGLGAARDLIPQEGARMAVCILTIGPIILIYPFLQKYFVKGLTIGSVKG